jgi:hypothetical protein
VSLNWYLEQSYFKGNIFWRLKPVYNIINNKNGKRNVEFYVW